MGADPPLEPVPSTGGGPQWGCPVCGPATPRALPLRACDLHDDADFALVVRARPNVGVKPWDFEVSLLQASER